MNTEELDRKYELMVIFSGELAEKDFERELDEMRKVLQESTGGITYEANWGKRNLAFRIKRQQRGYYAVFNFPTAAESIAELQTTIKLNPQVLRHMLITVPDDYEPGHHEDLVIPEEKQADNNDKLRSSASAAGVRKEKETAPKPELSTEDQQKELKNVEKKLEQILENPDIDIK